MTDVLAELVAGALADAAIREAAVPLRALEGQLSAAAPPLDPLPRFRTSGISLIAEVKRASPSKGPLAEIPQPEELAAAYQRGGAAAISVLTESRRFAGSLADLVAVRERVDIPVLRKDFMVSEYQIIEARVHGADLCLLIVAALDDTRLRRLFGLVRELGMTPLVEVHTAVEAYRALDAGASLIGINNRDLRTLHVDTTVFAKLAPLVPEGVIRVAESGISGTDDVRHMHDAGAHVVLVGEALVRAGNPAASVAGMLAAGGATVDDPGESPLSGEPPASITQANIQTKETP